MTVPALIALDWGTSSLRAYLMSADGAVDATTASAHGIQSLPEPGAAGFERAFAGVAGDWLAAHGDLPVVAGGMVGSAQGWREAPYVGCPAGPDDLAAAAAVITTNAGQRVHVAPGVRFDPPGAAPDVMRGEEVQIAGALIADPTWSQRARIVLPGTHCKWVDIADGRIVGFATYMTGELFAVLKQHSILGRLMPATAEAAEAERTAAFAEGVAAAGRGEALSHALFATRTLGLTGRLSPGVLADYLSGLLIGHEVIGALASGRDDRPLILIGDAVLCHRYADALALCHVDVAAILDNTAPAGLHRFARAAGLIAEPRHA